VKSSLFNWYHSTWDAFVLISLYHRCDINSGVPPNWPRISLSWVRHPALMADESAHHQTHHCISRPYLYPPSSSPRPLKFSFAYCQPWNLVAYFQVSWLLNCLIALLSYGGFSQLLSSSTDADMMNRLFLYTTYTAYAAERLSSCSWYLGFTVRKDPNIITDWQSVRS
jgi:hypothetical protein